MAAGRMLDVRFDGGRAVYAFSIRGVTEFENWKSYYYKMCQFLLMKYNQPTHIRASQNVVTPSKTRRPPHRQTNQTNKPTNNRPETKHSHPEEIPAHRGG